MNKDLEKAKHRLNIHKSCAQITNGCCIVNKRDLETVLNYIENSISKENNMCKCCKEIKFLKEIYDKRFTFKAGIVTKSKGGTATHSSYPLNYCPMCGRKFTK